MKIKIPLIKGSILLIIFFLGTTFWLSAQERPAFAEEVEALTQKNDSLWDPNKETIVFTGSSSIRKWDNLQASFPEHQVLNAGFGGSQASDLLYYLDTLVLRYNPTKVFIYEGDNDISAKKRPRKIIGTTEMIIGKLRRQNPDMKIVLISAKPSISRWHLRRKYKRLNRKFLRLTKKDESLLFADVWYPMLNGKEVKKDIFVSDGLHMNQKGYDIWFHAMQHLVNNP
ncbi:MULTISPECIES: GDSL-type esterase/lipase family protein [Maribacter]|uniref:GDSL-type esterase/lipase family protein n=1 Tax=Maribacter flavus TaxID=1658664 RepID=A0ABU7ILG4_9FLAO|nr:MULTISPECIES: GDSL-type esterase/lipase family protein [Maribacter]MDC6406528.1 GDSL-type esterase/lipase family protein [Maribacter sp. PR66]MEE1973646.1 GDSL-type esterase/lipase family protein [Maribacter flavus]